MTKITKKDILAELRVVAEEHPNKRQTRCVYAQYRKPHCVIGTALHSLGVPPAVLRKLDGCANNLISDDEAQETLTEAGFKMTDAAVRVARAAQSAADDNGTWGTAYKVAAKAAKPSA